MFNTHFKMTIPVLKYILFNADYIIIDSSVLRLSLQCVLYSILALFPDICFALIVF